jgi:hypothetical protein
MSLNCDAVTQLVLCATLTGRESLRVLRERLVLSFAGSDQGASGKRRESNHVAEEFVEGMVLVGEDDHGADGLALRLGRDTDNVEGQNEADADVTLQHDTKIKKNKGKRLVNLKKNK